jgi:hypothetical protein
MCLCNQEQREGRERFDGETGHIKHYLNNTNCSLLLNNFFRSSRKDILVGRPWGHWSGFGSLGRKQSLELFPMEDLFPTH